MSAPERTTLALRMARAAERVARGGVRTDFAARAHTRRSQIPARPGEHLTLMPGQLHFGGHAATLRTLLGSCLAVTLWHPERRLGGMCHFLLPSRQRKEDEPLDGALGRTSHVVEFDRDDDGRIKGTTVRQRELVK